MPDVFDEWTDVQVEAFHCPVPNLALSGGLGAAKTAFGGRWALAEMILAPGSRGAIAAPTYDQLFGTVFVEMEECLQKWGIRYRFQAWQKRLVISNGSSVRFVSFQVPSENLKGYEYDWGLLDEADATEPEHFQLFSDRIGRNRRRGGSGKLRVLGNPVPYGHWMYQEFRARNLPHHDLWEIPTYANRRFLAPGYIEKLEKRYPEGSIGRKRWLLGWCGIPDEHALFGDFDSSKDIITESELREAGVARYDSCMSFSVGHPVGYLRGDITGGGVVAAAREVYHNKRQPHETVRAVRAVHEGGRIAADDEHELYPEFRRHLPLRRARFSESVGIARLRRLIAEDRFKLLVDDNGEPLCPNLRNELEMHKASEITGKPEPQHRSLVWPAMQIAAAQYGGIGAEEIRRLGLHEALDIRTEENLLKIL